MKGLIEVRLMVLMVLMVAMAGVWLGPLGVFGQLGTVIGNGKSPYLKVYFLDIGQGDAIFIESPEGFQVLVDGGPDGTVVRQLAESMPFYDRSIDIIIATHSDKDHIGGLIDVLSRFEVGTIIKTENVNDTQVSRQFEHLVAQSKSKVLNVRAGTKIRLGDMTVLEVLFPETDTRDMESNASSIVLKVQHGDTSFLLTGDSPKRIEEYLVIAYGESLQSDVLKVGHHGSRTSTSELFIDEVQPSYAVVSAGLDNQYGHPHVEVTDLLFNAGVTVLNTADVGTIRFYSDGERVWLK